MAGQESLNTHKKSCKWCSGPSGGFALRVDPPGMEKSEGAFQATLLQWGATGRCRAGRAAQEGLLWGYSVTLPLQVHTARCAEAGIFFCWHLLYFHFLGRYTLVCLCAHGDFVFWQSCVKYRNLLQLHLTFIQHQEKCKNALQTTGLGWSHLSKTDCIRFPGDTWQPHTVSSSREPGM